MKKFIITLVVFVFVTITTNAQWQHTSLDSNLVSCMATNGINIFAGTWANHGIYLSTDNGNNWASVNTGLTSTSINSLAINGTNTFAGTYGGVFLSTNNGINWNPANNGLTSVKVYSLAVNGTTIYAGTTNAGVFLSTNNGASWSATEQDSALIKGGVTSFAFSGNNIFAGTYGRGVFLSTNNGTSWNEVNTGLSDKTINALAVYGTTILAGANNDGVFISTNNGANWTAVNNMTNVSVWSFAISGNNIFAGTYDGVFISTDNGVNWATVNTDLTTDYIYSLVVSGTNLFAGSNKGVWKRPLSEMVGIKDISSSSIKINIYPNPATTNITIECSKQAVIEILNVQGQCIQSLALNAEITNIDISALPKGMYFIKMKTENNIETGKFIKE